MSTPKQTAAQTAADHERVTRAEGAKMAAMAAAAKPEGRRRKGLRNDDQVAIVGMLRDGKTWSDVERRFAPEVEPEVLAGWRVELERRAGADARARLPGQG